MVSSFESLAGIGAAKSHTALALQAMSRHFGSLRDAIISNYNIYHLNMNEICNMHIHINKFLYSIIRIILIEHQWMNKFKINPKYGK